MIEWFKINTFVIVVYGISGPQHASGRIGITRLFPGLPPKIRDKSNRKPICVALEALLEFYCNQSYRPNLGGLKLYIGGAFLLILSLHECNIWPRLCFRPVGFKFKISSL